MLKNVTITRWDKTEESRSVDEVKRVITNSKNRKAWVVLSDGSSGNIELEDAGELAEQGIEIRESALVRWLGNGQLSET
jgi:hypothetical protein